MMLTKSLTRLPAEIPLGHRTSNGTLRRKVIAVRLPARDSRNAMVARENNDGIVEFTR